MKFHRPVLMGAQGMVATGHPLASSAALDVLKEGGNAFDAALCASGVLAVVKSYHCGLGGDVFGIFYSAKERRVSVLNGSGRSPRRIRRDMFAEKIPHQGMLAASTPGTVDAWLEAAARLGTRSIGDLLKPAIAYAREGFPVFPHLASVIKASRETLGTDPAWAEIFLPQGKIPEVGDLLIQRDLAATLAEVAKGGREVFYSGDIAKSIVRSSEGHDGYFCLSDFTEHRSRWEEPLSTQYGGYEVCVPPPNSYGLCLLLQLKMLTDYDLASYGHNTPEYVALQIGAKEEVWRRGHSWLADPDQYPREEIVEFLNQFPRAAQKDHRGAPKTTVGNDTTYIATADKFGNWASLIQSVHHSFGCGIVVEGTGIVLNNRMSGFNLIPGHANELAPAKLPSPYAKPRACPQGQPTRSCHRHAGRAWSDPVSYPDPVQSF